MSDRYSLLSIPGLSITGITPVMSITVDSMPTSHCSPIMTASILPSMSSSTSSALVGLGLPEILALSAAIGLFAALIRLYAVPFEGILTATVSSPPVVASGTIADFGKTIVSGPGQTSFISLKTSSPRVTIPPATRSSSSSASAIWTIIGLSDGLPFASYTDFTAFSSSAFAPSP